MCLQVITCEEIIGWRERTGGIGSRVILYMTDEEFHIAGEGRVRSRIHVCMYVRMYVESLTVSIA